MKWIDYAYSNEGNLLYNFGVEGLTYNMVNGYPKYTDLIMKNPDGLPVATAMAKHILGSQNWALVQDIRYFEQFQSPLAMKAIGVWTKAERDRVVPPLSLSAAESADDLLQADRDQYVCRGNVYQVHHRHRASLRLRQIHQYAQADGHRWRSSRSIRRR